MPASPVADLTDLLASAAREAPERVAVVESGGRRVTWAELDAETNRVAHGMVAAGLVAGHRVAIASANRLEFVTTYLAVLRIQAVAVPLNPRSSPAEVEHALADSGAVMVVADEVAVGAVRTAVAALAERAAGDGTLPRPGVRRAPRIVLVGSTLAPGERSYDHLRATGTQLVRPVLDPEKLAVLLYTSGATGRPRAAMLSHRALLANVDQLAQVDPPLIHGDDVVLGVLPLFHVYGLGAVLGSVLRHRARLVLVTAYDPVDTLELVEDEACSVVPIAPVVLQQWRTAENLAERLGPVRLLLSGSSMLEPAFVEEVTALTGVPVHQGYGLTEAAPVVTSTLCSVHNHAGSVGAAIPGVEIRLEDGAGRAPEPGDPGQVLIRGDNLFSGYWPDGADGPGPEGWWNTGDVGFLDEEGDLWLVDRVKDLVIVSGFNVYPVEVEEVILDVEGVRAAAVVGVADARTGEAVVAYVLAPGLDEAGAAALAERVRAHCASRLARFKQPAHVAVVDELPMTVTGKVRKGILRAAARRRDTELFS
ncbi:class I adenylate-forming enzyme family protein [Nocardioides sp. GY 10127]|uniref:class I adenylate-forming enzyme family protein n=1 Tax=Nocardioides sp. GY 10127 TaxID=2569762 RepID=UPI0010A90D12|nr:class I adenylate-forming enzyme family protein [Nocardioides sp. GY 10127]TIC80120.1 acyl--CoA ligase [Nocardioides sp. GY 10127]